MVQTKPLRKIRAKQKQIRLPGKNAGYNELADFFDRHSGGDLMKSGITEVDPDQEDLRRMLREYRNQPNTRQLNIRIPESARRLIEKLARRKTIEVSTLVRMWIIDGMRREVNRS
jgi:hypothetical protein